MMKNKKNFFLLMCCSIILNSDNYARLQCSWKTAFSRLRWIESFKEKHLCSVNMILHLLSFMSDNVHHMHRI